MSKKSQTMMLDKEGLLLSSCDTIFSTENLLDKDLREVFPFLESVFLELLTSLEPGVRVYFPKVETKHVFLSGYYDYSFKLVRIKRDQWGILWDIIDATEQYSVLKKRQQSDHERGLKDSSP